MAAMKMYKKRFPLMAVLIIAALIAVLRFAIFYSAAATIKIGFDIIIIGFAALVCYKNLGMVREVNYIVIGVLLIAIGQIAQDWPFYLAGSMTSETMALSITVRYLFNFVGFGVMFYGLVKFYEKYKFD